MAHDLEIRRDLVIPGTELVETASRSGGPGGQHVNKTSTRVTLRWSVEGDRVHLLVEDEGPGLADTPNLFVPFYTTKQGGSGIGLVLSRQIAEGHAGNLELENRDDARGARARMILPLDPES